MRKGKASGWERKEAQEKAREAAMCEVLRKLLRIEEDGGEDGEALEAVEQAWEAGGLYPEGMAACAEELNWVDSMRLKAYVARLLSAAPVRDAGRRRRGLAGLGLLLGLLSAVEAIDVALFEKGDAALVGLALERVILGIKTGEVREAFRLWLADEFPALWAFWANEEAVAGPLNRLGGLIVKERLAMIEETLRAFKE